MAKLSDVDINTNNITAARVFGPYAYRTRTFVDAFQYDGSLPLDFLRDGESVRRSVSGAIVVENFALSEALLVGPGQYIVRAANGHLRALTAADFEATYEKVLPS